MKKFLVMFAIAGALVACNNSSETTTTNSDSMRIVDSLKAADSLKMMNNDSSHMNKMIDSSKMKMDHK